VSEQTQPRCERDAKQSEPSMLSGRWNEYRMLRQLTVGWLALSLTVALLGITFLAFYPSSARADVLEVCHSGCEYKTILGALHDANPGDTVWVRAGEYSEKEPVTLKSGVVLRGEDPEHPELTIIRGEGTVIRGTGVRLTTTCVLEGFTILPIGENSRAIFIQDRALEIIRNNIISGAHSSYFGPAIRIQDPGTAPTIINNLFINNRSSAPGGAIYVEDASPLIIGNTFISNHTDRDGGAIALNTIGAPLQQAVITGNVFLSNTALAKGGAIYSLQSRPLIQGNDILSNTAQAGAGIYIHSSCSSGPAIVQGNRIAFNKTLGSAAAHTGGGLAIVALADAHVDSNWIRYNVAGLGDGIYVDGSTPRITNNVLVANRRTQLLVSKASPHIINNTILGLGTMDTVGIDLRGAGHSAIVNNIVAFAGYGLRGDGVAAPVISYNNLWMNLSADSSGVSADATNLYVDPELQDPEHDDYHLRPGSPMIDAGTADGAPPADFDGEPRPIDGNGDGVARPDIGADEYNPPPSPTPTASPSATATQTEMPTATATPTTSPTSLPAATPTPMSCTILGIVTLQGRPPKPHPSWSVTLTVTVGETSHNVMTDAWGSFSLSGLVSGTYDIGVKNWHTLRNVKSGVLLLPWDINVLDFGLLLEGDANDDNQVNIADFSILAAHFHPAYDARADFNQDGRVNINDFSLLATNFGKRGDMPVE